MIVWIIGLAGAGKTTLGYDVALKLRTSNRNVVHLDGDVLRTMYGNSVGHDLAGRKLNSERLRDLSLYLESRNDIVLCSILSLFDEDRHVLRKLSVCYLEVYLDISMATLVRRDQKRLYSKASLGLISNVAGVDLDFFPPESPDLVLNDDDQSKGTEFCSGKVLELLKPRLTDGDL